MVFLKEVVSRKWMCSLIITSPQYYFRSRRLKYQFVSKQHIDLGWLEWMVRQENIRYLDKRNASTTKETLLKYLEESKPPKAFFFAAHDIASESYIGNIRISQIDIEERSATYGR